MPESIAIQLEIYSIANNPGTARTRQRHRGLVKTLRQRSYLLVLTLVTGDRVCARVNNSI